MALQIVIDLIFSDGRNELGRVIQLLISRLKLLPSAIIPAARSNPIIFFRRQFLVDTIQLRLRIPKSLLSVIFRANSLTSGCHGSVNTIPTGRLSHGRAIPVESVAAFNLAPAAITS